ncbi:MAG: methyltransferase domain-containing protein [Gammaproteobacteria bacterium]|nr:methyltransferase domain-containing protein [Gammaproteobacteria bacterium]MBU6510160.1 methyltransferase domain-containing protein [Gammaproteobacteria bacterium]MDE1984063.1 methyltransferase domain-containing protein [Gammaproteobacteria bacterium]MDE2108409.1 methyltransferase domain-containing protein [Gammaproteobacteria bacterium]
MTKNLNPQKEHMADESMVRTLAAQTEAIWPQERILLADYGLAPNAKILDVGCGTGEFTWRCAELFPRAQVLGIDVLPQQVEYARRRHSALAPRLEFHQGDAFALALPDDGFDLVACRHMLQSVPEPERIIAELIRVTRPGGRLHLLVEDYGMIHAYPTRGDLDAFWQRAMAGFATHMHIDPRIGRRAWFELHSRGIQKLSVSYLTVDTLRVPRDTLARIFESWGDGYAATVAETTGLSVSEARAGFDDISTCIRNPQGYAVWHVPIASGIKPNTPS